MNKKPITPSSQIKNYLRQLWLRSRERAAAVKRDASTCQKCGKKGSVAKGREVKIHVHHEQGIENWSEIERVIRKHLLCDQKHLVCLCKECHKEIDK